MSTSRLKSIKICDFKSYKGVVEISDIKQFTAVIGPNGSGKSNFMDAVGFGLGENYKSFRVNNLSELIHGATIKKPIADRCYVTLTFLLEDGNEKSFTRTVVGISQRNKYEVNESIVSSDVYYTELNLIGIRDHGKSCLIFQGYIESIAMQDPKERCTFFERMCNSIQFQEEYIRSKREMEKAKEKVQSTFEQLKILNLEVKFLSAENKDAEVFINLQKQERNLERYQQLVNLFYIEEDVRELDDTFQSKSKEKGEIKRQISEAKSQLDYLRQAIQDEKQILSQMKEEIENKETIFEEKKAISMEIHSSKIFLAKKRDRASKSLADSEKKWESQKTNIRDLRECKEICEEKLAVHDLDSLSDSDSQSPRSLDEQQFQKYSRLKLEATKQTSLLSQQLEPKIRELQKYQDRLDNETRKKTEIAASIQITTSNYKKNQERLDKLKQKLDEENSSLIEKETYRDNLKKEIDEAKIRLLELQIENDKLTEDLKNAKYDKYCLQREKKKNECIRHLQNFSPDVIGRLIDLCKPVHPRYNIAFAKIFEIYGDAIVMKTAETAKKCIHFLKDRMLGIEMFIPLDGIEVHRINERLRGIKDPPNVRLAYDVIEFSPAIDLAIRFVTKNILVCDTIQHAKELSACRQTIRGPVLGHTCVSLNGTMFKKYGTISGGTFDLVRQVKKWDDKVISQMKLRKQIVEEELKTILQKTREESTLVLLNLKIEGAKKSNKFIENHLVSIVKEQEELETKVRDLKAKEEEISNTVEEIKNVISEKEEAINVIKQKITDVEDNVFRSFCQEIGYTNIRKYERKDLKMHQQKREEIQQLRDHLNRINNQLEFEESRDFESEVLKWKKDLAEIQAKLDAETEKETAVKREMQKIEAEFKIEHKNIENKKSEIEDAMKTCRNYDKTIKSKTEKMNRIREELDEINEQKSMLKRKMKEILQTCQMRELQIPLRYGNLEIYLLPQETDEEVSIEIDYSELPEDYKSRENRTMISENLTTQIYEIQETLERLRAPNQKIEGRLKALKQQRQRIMQKIRDDRLEARQAEEKYEAVKTRRTEVFSSFMTKISDSIDQIYKRLTRSNSAQALLIAQNPEEPYLSGIIYSCVAPGKKVVLMDGLSGGEKTIATLALLLAIQKANPTPFFLLDEVDAALDSVNIDKFANFIQEEKEHIQFIIISLKLKLFREAEALVGITPGDGQCLRSCIFTFDLQKYQE